MYENHYGLREKPFSLLPDPDYLMLGSKHRMAYSLLEYGLNYSDGFTVITGEIGCGKTTLVQHLLRSTGPQITFAFISDTIRLQGEILERVLMAYGLETGAQNDKWTDKFKRFSEFAVDEYAKGRRLVVIIDEAQNMDTEALEELRVLSNINSGKNLLVQIILTGQPELRQKLSEPRLKQFAQRIGKLYHLMPLDHKETREYIYHRIKFAGGKPGLFTDNACGIIYAASGGVPRLINKLCDAALVYGYGMDKQEIDQDVMVPVLADQSHAWTVTPDTLPPEPGDFNLIHETMADSSPGSESLGPKTIGGSCLDLGHLEPEANSDSAENTDSKTLDLDAREPANHDDDETGTTVRGLHYASANSAHRQRFGLPMNGSVSNIEWLDIVCKNEKERVRRLFAQYQDQDSTNFKLTTTIVDASNRRILVNLVFETREDGIQQWLPTLGKQYLKLDIVDRLADTASSSA